jgi:hypothetical protein
MDRRQFVGSTIAASVALFAAANARSAESAGAAPLPRRDRVKVAFMLGDNTNVIDTAGPWEVFQDTVIDDGGHHRDAFELFTVAPKEGLLRMTGGLAVKPE